MKLDKKRKGIILWIFILAFLVLGWAVLWDSRDESRDYAEAFLERVTTKKYSELFDTKEIDLEGLELVLKEDYSGIMTEKGFEKAVSNRYIPWDIFSKTNPKYAIEVASLELKKMLTYEDGRQPYQYFITLNIKYEDGKQEAVTVTGDLVMALKDSKWLVDVFRCSTDYQSLYKKLPF